MIFEAKMLPRRLLPFAIAIGIWLIPVPAGLTAPAWHLFAIFVASIAAVLRVRPRVEGAVAAPTAGLHFPPGLLGALENAGVAVVRVLLHVGPGTFRRISAPDPREHRMDEEWFEVTDAAARALSEARARGGRIVAVGTTVARALESACDANAGALAAAAGWTRKFILPPYEFRAVDALVTNFHLPRTTLLLLVAAFAGEDLTRRAYAHAVAGRYRFYSYGDAMLLL